MGKFEARSKKKTGKLEKKLHLTWDVWWRRSKRYLNISWYYLFSFLCAMPPFSFRFVVNFPRSSARCIVSHFRKPSRLLTLFRSANIESLPLIDSLQNYSCKACKGLLISARVLQTLSLLVVLSTFFSCLNSLRLLPYGKGLLYT